MSWHAEKRRRCPGACGPPTCPACDATLEGFDFSYNPKLPTAQIRDLARLEFVAAGEGLCLYGPVGVGKTHLAAALAHQACRRGFDATFLTASRLLAELAGGHADRSFAVRLQSPGQTRRPRGR